MLVDTFMEWVPLFALFVAIWATNSASARGLKAEIQALRADMKAGDDGIRSDMKDMEAGIRSDMKAGDDGIRADMKAGDDGIRADMKHMETRLTAEMEQFRIDLRELRTYTASVAESATRRSEALSERLDANNARIDNLVDELRRSSVTAG